jgi:3-oxoadipate enol-lactonase
VNERVKLHYRVAGPPDAEPVLLLHALGTTLEMWSPQVPILSREYHVVAVDLRGHGRSPVPPGPYSIGGLAEDVLSLLDELDIDRASVCGLSLGAMVGLSMAATAPRRVHRLIAACVVAVPAAPAAWLDRAQRVRAGGTVEVSELVVERWGYRDRQPAIAQRIRDMLAATPAEGYAACCDAIAAMDLRAGLGWIEAPTLLIVGADDPAAPLDAAESIASAMVDVRVTVIEGAAHLANIEAADEVTAAISAHLGGMSDGVG